MSTGAVFIDAANVWHTGKRLGWYIDWKKLREFFEKQFPTIDEFHFFYYTARLPGEAETIGPMLTWLKKNGFTVVEKPVNHDKKGNMDIEMALDAFNMAKEKRINHAFFFTGDTDFAYLFDALKKMLVVTTVLSSKETHPSMISESLCERANFIEIVPLRGQIARKRSP